MQYEYTYKYSKRCPACVFLKYKKNLKDGILNDAEMFNGTMKIPDVYRKYAISVPAESFRMHCIRHINKIERKVAVTGISENAPVKDVVADLKDASLKPHEQVLDEFIDQFSQTVKQKQFKMTVKDGLQAIKMKSDIVKGDKDRKKDILKMMVGAYDEPRRPPERTTTPQ